MTKVTISVPEELFSEVERRRTARDQSRSEFFRAAVEALLRTERDHDAVERYVRAYTRAPESEDEILAAHATAVPMLGDQEWD